MASRPRHHSPVRRRTLRSSRGGRGAQPDHWKYVLRLDLTDSGFDASVLSEFRTRLLDGQAEQLLLDTLLTWCRERQLVNARGRQRTDGTHVLAAVRALNRIEVVGETMRHALNSLAVVAPSWLERHANPDWVARYARRAEDDRLPAGQAARDALALTIGSDGYALLIALSTAAPVWLREVPAVETLRRVWIQQYHLVEGAVHWRAAEEIPPATTFISSPHDLDAHYAKKRSTSWVGYKVHLTETCEDDLPHLITHVETSTAPVGDGEMIPRIHADLAEKDLLPSTHIVDAGYMDAALLVTSRAEYDVDLLGPAREDHTWQAREGQGFKTACFAVDWDAKQLTCPGGRTSVSWTPAVDHRKIPVIKVKFAVEDCRPCPHRPHCTTATYPRRTVTIRPQAAYQALEAARARGTSRTFKKEYGRRAGSEGTFSHSTRTLHLRRCRYIGLPKTRLQHLLTAAAMNFVRVGLWLDNTPRAKTRRSRFTVLMSAAA